MDLVHQVVGYREVFARLKDISCCEGLLNLMVLALNLSKCVNRVAKKHSEVSRLTFSDYPIDAITNGVHASTWTSNRPSYPSLSLIFSGSYANHRIRCLFGCVSEWGEDQVRS
jgi:glucan phosphorylase